MVVADTDFLSSFAKVGRLDLVLAFFGTDRIAIPRAVLREIKDEAFFGPYLARVATDAGQLPARRFILAVRVDAPVGEPGLGAGEREAIALAMREGGALLMSDREAGRAAEALGVPVVDVFSFLLACARAGLCTRDELAGLVRGLEELDHYRFGRKERSMLGL